MIKTLLSSTIIFGPSLLLLAAPFSSAQPSQCPSPEYCGGAHGSPESEMSCTPFPVRFDDASSESWYDLQCNHPNLDLLTGGNPYGAKAWRDSGKKDDHYWVFHGCDKAGTMDDVCEQTGYVELIGPYSDETTPLTLHDCSGVGEGWDTHCIQPFVHPGTGNVYSYYWAGMMAWNSDTGSWADANANKPWWDNMGLPHIKDLGADEGTGFVVMYPWVCGYYGEDLAYLWGHHQPYGDSTDGTKCYYDNEPWNNDHWHGTTVPPVWKAYKFVSDGKKVTGWLLAEKKAEWQDPEYYFGSNNSFELVSMHGKKNGPWEGGLEIE